MEERATLLGEVERFAVARCGPGVGRPEEPMPASALAALLAEAEELGLCGSALEPSGLGPWETLGGDEGAAVSLSILERLAAVDASLAYAVHQRALARAACRRLGIREEGPFAVAPRGRFGLGRDALGALLAGRALETEALALLGDLYAPDAPRILALDPGFAGLLTPALDAGGHLFFQLHRGDTLTRHDHPHAHGLDALTVATLAPRAAAAHDVRDPLLCRAVLAETLAAEQLGLLALTAGAVAHAASAARHFASERRQGGTRIERHPAVLELLGRAESTLETARHTLGALGALPLGLAAVPRVLRARASLQGPLAEAANASLQVFGGLGYMRDNGLEKIVRDVNSLRALGGSPLELRLATAGWEGPHG